MGITRYKRQQPKYNLFKGNAYTGNQIYLRNPWVVAWWSFAFPGFGHYMVNSYLWGFIFMSFEYFVNSGANINTSIYYSMIGNFEQAKQVINHRWFLLYIVAYIFAVWDSYRRTVDLNKLYPLAYSDTKSINPFYFSSLEINLLEKKMPWMSIIWSFLMPSIGYVYLHRLWSFLFGAVWWFVVLYFSHLLEGVYFTMTGNFEAAKQIMDPQWILYLPSIYCFNMYNSYVLTIENNKLYEIYQAKFLKEEYQQGDLENLYNG